CGSNAKGVDCRRADRRPAGLTPGQPSSTARRNPRTGRAAMTSVNSFNSAFQFGGGMDYRTTTSSHKKNLAFALLALVFSVEPALTARRQPLWSSALFAPIKNSLALTTQWPTAFNLKLAMKIGLRNSNPAKGHG